MSKEEQIRASINNIDSDILKDTLAILLSKNENIVTDQREENKVQYHNFAQAIMDLKNRFDFPELNYFSTEADLVYVQAGDRKVLLTEKTDSPTPNGSNSPARPKVDSPLTEEDAFENINSSDTRFSHLEL